MPVEGNAQRPKTPRDEVDHCLDARQQHTLSIGQRRTDRRIANGSDGVHDMLDVF